MELEIYSAFVRAGIAAEDAKAAVDSISKEIDKRYALHSQQLATRGDVEGVRKEVAELRGANKAEIAEAKFEIIKWTVGSMLAAVGLFATLVKIWH
jgi:hypothetical protein